MNKIISLGVMLLVSGLVSAQQSGFFVGGGIGQAKVKITDDAASAITDSGGSFVTGNTDDTDISYKLFGGYKINKNLAFEGGYAFLGKYKSEANGIVSGRTLTAQGNVKNYAIFVDGVGIYPASQDLLLLGKLGFAYTNTKADASASMAGISASVSESSNRWVPKLGIGAQYNVTKAVALRAEYEYYFNVGNDNTTGQSDIKVLSAGITFGF